MLDVNNHERWNEYERRKRSAKTAWLQSLTGEKSMALYEEMHRMAVSSLDAGPAARLRVKRLKEKIACHRRLREAFAPQD
jgi:hypothetical protein